MTTDVRQATSLGREVVLAAASGVIAALAMGGYAMVAYLLADKGFFTPLHQLASVFLSPGDMQASMASAAAGAGFDLLFGAAVVGAGIHLLLGAGYGAMFGASVGRHRLEATVLTAAGFAWGALVLVTNTFVALPLAAAVFAVPDLAGGNPIADMAHVAGWGHFTIGHLLFGLVLGAMVARLTPRESPE